MYGPGYRAAVTLVDGTYLPCAIFYNADKVVAHAIGRFKEVQSNKALYSKASGFDYEAVVKTYIAGGNKLKKYSIAAIEKSRFALPVNVLKLIRGETSMGWTAFVAKFKDGRSLGFGTSWNVEFFDLPEDYNADDIVDIVNNSYQLNTGEIVGHRELNRPAKKEELASIKTDRLFFECYLDHL